MVETEKTDIGTPLYEILNHLAQRGLEGETWKRRFERSLKMELAGYQLTVPYQLQCLKSLLTSGRHLPNMTAQQLAHAILENVAKEVLARTSPQEAVVSIVGNWMIDDEEVAVTSAMITELNNRVDPVACPALASIISAHRAPQL